MTRRSRAPEPVDTPYDETNAWFDSTVETERLDSAAAPGPVAGRASFAESTGWRVIFVNRFFHPDISATSQMLSDLAFGLLEDGFDVHVVTSRTCYDRPETVLAREESIHGVSVHRVATTRFGRHRLWRRLGDYIAFYMTMTIAVVRLGRRGDTLVIKTDPPLMSVALVMIAGLRGLRTINWYQDVFPEVAEAADIRLGPRWLAPMLLGLSRRLRDWSLSRSGETVAIGNRMRSVLHGRLPRHRVTVIPNWADADNIVPIAAEDNALRREWNLVDRFVVAYSGNLGITHPIAAILDAIERLRDEEHIVFLFVGGGVRLVELEREVHERRLGRSVRFFPYQPRERLSESLGAGDVHLVSLEPRMEGLVVPSKFYGIGAAGRPTLFIGAPDGELAAEIRERCCGTVIDVDDGAALASALRAYAGDAERCRREGERARRHVVEHHSLARAHAAWRRLLTRSDR